MAAQPAPWMRNASRGAYVEHLKTQRVASRTIAAALRDAAIDAERQIIELMGGGIGDQVRRAQLQTVAAELRKQQAALWGKIQGATADGIRAASLQAAEGNLLLMNYLVSAGADSVLSKQFTLAAQHSVESVRAKYLNDVRLSPRVYKNQQVGIRRAQREVVRGLAQNQSARQIAKRVRHLINPNTPGGVSYAAKRLARTEINNAFHGTNTLWYAESPFVEAVQWNISNSHPQPDECDDYAEQDRYRLGPGMWKPEDVPHKPHPNCLCYTVAVTVKPEDFVKTLTSGGYDSWLAEQGFADVRFGAA